ncbi:NUDIX domain-containing protein [Abyssisolibacter fermentans]|uniref:NUDIX domain-containing protein n=1 Tax=Abyssisolibacter fermentans TaxID=1766203 RepID=UPI00083147B7|nr:NUDIX domain-containing protein [Abyssisolibacter fermentans]
MSNYRLSARAIVIKDDKVLLNKFNNGEYYNLPGGGVEVDETLRATVAREVLEESGLSVHVKEMLYIYEYNPIRDEYRYGSRGSLSHVFRCEIDESKGVVAPTEIDYDPTGSSVSTGCKWVTVKELKDINLVPSINDIIIEDITKKNFTTKFLENIH